MAPKTDAERQRERRKRLKENPEAYQVYLESDRDRKKQVRLTFSKEKMKKVRKQQKLATRRCRAKQKGLPIQEEEAIAENDENDAEPIEQNPYRSRQALGKAKKRAMRSLPQSPRKRKVVLEQMTSEILGVVLSPKSSKKADARAISDEVKQLVIDFYHEQAYTMPGKADVVTVTTDAGKEKRQKKLLVMTIDEMLEIFKNEHPDVKIGRTKFSELRPKEVLLSSETPRNVCGCIYHANIILLMEALHEHSEIPLYTRKDFSQLAVCLEQREDCFSNACEIRPVVMRKECQTSLKLWCHQIFARQKLTGTFGTT